MKTVLVTAVVMMLSGMGCQKLDQNQVEIRIQNSTSDTIEQVVVFSEGGEKGFGSIPAYQSSGYKAVEGVYPIPACRFNVKDRHLVYMIRCATPSLQS